MVRQHLVFLIASVVTWDFIKPGTREAELSVKIRHLHLSVHWQSTAASQPVTCFVRSPMYEVHFLWSHGRPFKYFFNWGLEFVQIQWTVREEHYSRRTSAQLLGYSFTLGSTQLACSCCQGNHKLASACARQLSSPQTPVVLIATADLEVTQPPYRFRRRWLLYLSLVCTSISDARSDVATASRLAWMWANGVTFLQQWRQR